MKRLITPFITAAMAMALVMPSVANAATGPWSWHDISSRVTYQTQRPIWAAAWSEDGWFYTDGLNLWSGGQVYWFDGQTSSMVTLDVRNANVERVDDMVSDRAGTVLFLQDVVRCNNTFRVAAYKNGSYVNYTDTVRSVFDSNEGISSITGRGGEFMIVTTKGRLFRWYANATPPREITLPSAVRSMSVSNNEMLYNVNHGVWQDNYSIRLAMVPVQSGNSWLLVARLNSSDTRLYKYNGSSFSQISEPADFGRILAVQSNGNEALMFVEYRGDGSYHATIYNGSAWNDVAAVSAYDSSGLLNEKEFDVDYNGESWMLIHKNKRLYRLTKNGLENYGETKDFFLTVAGNDSGEFLLGGAASEKGRSTPLSPLSAKLVRVVEDGGVSDGTKTDESEGEEDADTGINAWQWLDKNVSEIRDGESVTYNVGAWDADGIERIRIVVNGEVKRTCEFGGKTGNAECGHVIYADSYPENTNIFVNAQVWDAQGFSVWTSGQNIYRRADGPNGDGSYSDSDGQMSASISFNPNRTEFGSGESITANVYAWAQDGVRKIEFYVNGSVKRTCSWDGTYESRECAYTLWANDYPTGTDVFVNAKVTDRNGRETWTSSRTIWRTGEGASDSYSDGQMSASISFNPNRTEFGSGESITANVYAWAEAGVRKIEFYVNGSVKRTCSWDGTYESRECAYTLWANDYPAGTDVFVNAKVTDRNGRETWTSSRSIRRSDGSAWNPDAGVVRAESWFEGDAYIDGDESVIFRTDAWAGDGLRQIKVYVDGESAHTCAYNHALGTVSCDHSVSAQGRPNGAVVRAKALATDENGRTAWSAEKTVTVRKSAGSEDGDISVWDWLNPSVNEIAQNESVTYHPQSWAEAGVKFVHVYVNGSVARTCDYWPGTGNQDCAFRISGANYTAGTDVFVNARAVDYNGREMWTAGKTIHIRPQGTSYDQHPGSVTAWSNRDQGIANNQTITVYASAGDPDGVSRMEVYVNAERVKTCYGTTSCQVTAGPFNQYPYVTYAAAVYDVFGNSSWTGYRNVEKQ
jgi:hypothetical protein